MDPLSDVLSLLKPRSYSAGGFDVGGDLSIQFPRHEGIKCYAVVSGECWLAVDGVADAVLLKTGDCFLLPSGRPFRLASDLSLTPIDARTIFANKRNGSVHSFNGGGDCFIAGGHFAFAGSHASILLAVLPPIVHLRKESDKAAMRWSLERMMRELREPQPGGFLVAQQPRLPDAGAGPAAASGGRVERRRWVALRARGSTDECGDHFDARRSGAWLDDTEIGGTCGDVAIDLCLEVQTDCRGVAHGIFDALAHAAGWGQGGELERSHFRDCPITRL
jgi:hypothetical protein